MANSKIVIGFADEMAYNDYVQFTRVLKGGGNPILVRETFQPTRTSSYVCPITTPQAAPGWAAAESYATYFNIDYNGYGLYTISRNGNSVTIEFTNDLFDFTAFTTNAPGKVVLLELTNTVLPIFQFVPEPFVDFTAAVDTCNYVNVELETTELATWIKLNQVVVDAANTVNPAIIEIQRGLHSRIFLQNAGGDEVVYPLNAAETIYFDYLLVGNVSINVVPLLIGATINVSVSNVEGLTLQYSLDDVDYFSNNIFTGQAEGNYTMYIKDQFGCKIQKDYLVDDIGTRVPFLQISNANSISLKEQVDWDGCTILKNETNTLAHQGLEIVKNCDDEIFTICDNPTIQFKSNFETTIATLRKEDLTEVDLPITQMTNNLNRFAKMDAWYYKYNSAMTGIYFIEGDTYDEFDVVNGTFSLNGNLPDFAVKGNYINVDGLGAFEIMDRLFDDNQNKWVILIKNIYGGVDAQTKVDSIYDLLPFEVYEFSVDWVTHGIGLYDIKLENTDTHNGTVLHLSENINVAVEHEDTVLMRWFNDPSNNRGIFYKYGIQHIMRVPLMHKEGLPKDDTNINITDDSVDTVKSILNELDKFYFDTVGMARARRIAIALSSENIFIQDIGYAKESTIESENEINTNNYNLTVTLIKKGVNYTTNRQGQEDIDDNLGFNIPAFITDGTGFIKT